MRSTGGAVAEPRAGSEHDTRHGRSGLLRRFCWGLLFIAVVEIVILLFEQTGWWERLNRKPSDLVMILYRNSVIDEARAVPLTFIDIDDATFFSRNKDGSTDRRDLVDLVGRAVSQTPIAVVVDLDLSFEAAGDEALHNYIQDYSVTNPPLIFTQALRQRPDTGRKAALDFLPSQAHPPKGWPTKCPVGINRTMDRQPIYFASAGFLQHSDGLVRDWNLAEPILCDDGGGKRVRGLPSIELLVLAIVDARRQCAADSVKPPDPACVRAAVDRFSMLIDEAFKNDPDKPTVTGKAIPFGRDESVKLDAEGIGQRILYTMPWRSEHAPRITVGGVRTDLIRTINADTLLRQSPSTAIQPPADDRGPPRIILIGGSNSASRDVYPTPFGQMPGGMVLLNSISSLLQQGQLEELPPALRFLAGAGLGLIAWAAFEWLRFGLAITFACGIIAAVTLTAAWQVISLGVWLDLSGPVLALLCDGIREAAISMWEDREKWGFRALLAPRWRE